VKARCTTSETAQKKFREVTFSKSIVRKKTEIFPQDFVWREIFFVLVSVQPKEIRLHECSASLQALQYSDLQMTISDQKNLLRFGSELGSVSR
jgi:hypothetical protein